MAALAITWLGHSTFVLETRSGTRIVTDPWLDGNPACPADRKKIDKADVILVSHGHFDHTGDVVPVGRATNAAVVAVFELATWLQRKGLQNVKGMNMGGTQRVADLAVTLVQAFHSSSVVEDEENVYLGEPGGFVVRTADGFCFYFAGDTALFGDMALIKELYQPDLAFLPIGDLYTMGPDAAAIATRLLGVRQVVPMHFGTFPVLTGTPERFEALVKPLGVDVLVLKPGETAR